MDDNKLRIVSRVLCCFGLPQLIRNIRSRKGVTIINYHNPQPEIFETHVRLLADYYSFISIDNLMGCLTKKDLSSLPPAPLLVTFDDGYKENVRLIPIIQKYNIPAVFYCVAGMVNTKRHFWFDRLSHQSREMVILKSVRDKARRTILRSNYDHWDEKEYGERVSLSVDELKLLLSAGCTIGSHSMFHPILTKCDDEVGMSECQLSKKLLEDLLGVPIVHFAFPDGRYNAKAINWAKSAGYVSCRTTNLGWVRPQTSPFLLPSFGVNDTADPYRAILQVCGIWGVIKALAPSKSKVKVWKYRLRCQHNQF